MIEEVKKAFLASIGATVATKEKLESVFNELVEKGKVSKEEAQHMLDDLSKDSKKEYEAAKENIQCSIQSLLSKANFASKQQLEALEERIKSLESKIKKH
jgi:polyhydroxyalkanoate synthesis regulator phasin